MDISFDGSCSTSDIKDIRIKLKWDYAKYETFPL